MDEKLRILLCEDDENLGMLLKRIFAGERFILQICFRTEKPASKAFLKN